MKAVIIAALVSLGTVNTLSAEVMTDLGGGFSYVATGNGQCQVLFDSKYGNPVLRTSKRGPTKIILVGTRKDCPKEYNGYSTTRLSSGQANGFIYNGVTAWGQRLHIYRKIGSNFTFTLGPSPKK